MVLPHVPLFSANVYSVSALLLIVTAVGFILRSRARFLTRHQRIGCWVLSYDMVCVAGLFWFYLGITFDFSISMSTEGMSPGELRPWWVLMNLLRVGQWVGLPLAFVTFLLGGLMWLLNLTKFPSRFFQPGFWPCYLHLIVVSVAMVLWTYTFARVTSVLPMLMSYLLPTLLGYVMTRVLSRKVRSVETGRFQPSP